MAATATLRSSSASFDSSGSGSGSFVLWSSDNDNRLQLSSPRKQQQRRGHSIYKKPSILSRQSSKDTASFTFDKLRFSSLELYGRTTEKKILADCLERLTAGGGTKMRKQMVFLSGESGTGKTALAETLHGPAEKLGGVFVRGKCGYHHREEHQESLDTSGHLTSTNREPFDAIAQACRQLCEHVILLERDEVTEGIFDHIKSDLIETLGTELALMTSILPRLQELVGVDSPEENDDDVTASSGDRPFLSVSHEAKNRRNYAFRRFFRIMTLHIRPLVLLIDDLQWSDVSSLELLQSLISDPESTNLMIIGSFRSNEVGPEHRLSSIISELKEQQGVDFELCEIRTANLSFSDAHRLIMDLLAEDDDSRTLRFSEICHLKTNGNPFFLTQFLSMLHAKEILVFNISIFKWTWKEEAIEQCMATDNVVDLVKSKIQRLSREKIQILELAACLGYEIDFSTLCLVWSEMQRDASVDVGQSMEDLVSEGIFEQVKDGETKTYRWVHDKVHEAATSLTSSDNAHALKAQIGSILISRLKDSQLGVSIFVAVDLLNKGSLPQEKESRLELARHNLQAAKKAVEFAAFQSALTYAETGIAALPDGHFGQYPNLSLRLYTLAAKTAGYHGEIERMEYFCSEVIRQPHLDAMTKFDVYSAMIDSMANQGRRKEAIDLSLRVLAMCGCIFPRNALAIKLRTVFGVIGAKRRAKSLLPKEGTPLPMMTDRRKTQLIHMLDKVSTHLYLDKNPLFVLTILRKMQWILQDGWCKSAPGAFVSIGVVISGVLFDLQTGSAYAKYGLRLSHDVKGTLSEARALFAAYGLVLAYTRPLFSNLGPLLRAYEIAIQGGDVELACWCLAASMSIGYQSGKPLTQLEADCSQYVKQARELKRETQATRLSILWQVLLNLLSRSDDTDPTALTGDAMDEKETFEVVSSPGNASIMAYFYCWKCIMYTLFGDYDKAAEIALAEGDEALKSSPASPYLMMDCFYKGVSLFVMARTSGKRAYLRRAKKCLSVMKKWAEGGNPNVTHFERLLQAEMWVYQGRVFLAKNAFEAGSVLAARGGFIQDSAFASERYADFLYNIMGDKENAVFKFKAALSLYEEWGALAKVDHLRSKYEPLWSEPPTVISLPPFGMEVSEAALEDTLEHN